MSDTPKNRRGRPRTRPEGVRERCVYLTDPEYASLKGVAVRRGVSVAELIRQAALEQIPKKKAAPKTP